MTKNQNIFKILMIVFGVFLMYQLAAIVFPMIDFKSQQARADIVNGLIGYWKFDETSGTTAADSSGNVRAGTVSGSAVWASGKINNAIRLDGDGDNVDLPDNIGSAFSNELTFAAWIKVDAFLEDTDPEKMVIIVGANSDTAAGAYLRINSPTSISFVVGNGVARDSNLMTVSPGLSAGVWYHIVAKTTLSQKEIYIDGVLRAVDPVSLTGTFAGANLTSNIGIWGGTDDFNGLIDEVRIYSRALSSTEIQDLYNYTGGGSTMYQCSDGQDNDADGFTDYPNDIGCSSATDNDETNVQSGDTQAPSIPGSLTTTAVSSSQINLSWDASSDNAGVAGYRVERCQGSACTNFSQIATPSQTSYSDTGLTANTTYSYRVRAADAVPNLSDYSNIASATTQQQQQQGGNVVTAASGSAQAIQSAINNIVAAGGGTVTVPAGTWTWVGGDRVCIRSSVELRVKGAGQNQTIIQYASGQGPGSSSTCGTGYSGYGQSMFEFHGSGFKEFADMTISGASDIGVPVNLYVRAAQGMTNVRVHHASFKKATGSFIYWIENKNSVGLIDHVYIGDKASAGAYGIRLHGSNLESDWIKPVNFGANDGVFIEDSTFNGTYHPVAGHGTAKYTVRYNTFSNHSSALEGHGPSYGFGGISDTGGSDQPCYSGVYRVEVYNNTFNAAGYSTFQRSGHWIITDNIYKDQTQYGGPIVVEMESASIGTNCNIANSCPRASGWAGMGCNAAGKPGCWHNPQASYIWNNTFLNTGGATSNCRAQANDKSCTVINDKSTGCVRESKEVFFRAPLSGDPEITGTYAKFTYPHPLASGGQTSDTTPPSAPTGIAVN